MGGITAVFPPRTASPWPECASALVQGYGREPVVARTSASNDGTAELVRILCDASALFTSSAK